MRDPQAVRVKDSSLTRVQRRCAVQIAQKHQNCSARDGSLSLEFTFAVVRVSDSVCRQTPTSPESEVSLMFREQEGSMSFGGVDSTQLGDFVYVLVG